MNIGLINSLLESCCNWAGGNFLFGILIFTAITKVLLLPVSVWCQYNGLIMVRLMPEINRIKREYVGDFDMIAEEQRKLFKREHYQPLSSFLPLAALIFLLLTLFAAIDHVLKGSQGAFAGRIPVSAPHGSSFSKYFESPLYKDSLAYRFISLFLWIWSLISLTKLPYAKTFPLIVTVLTNLFSPSVKR